MTIAVRPRSPPGERPLSSGSPEPGPSIVLDFWFAAAAKPYWFKPHPPFDQAVTADLLPLRARALAGDFAGWMETPPGILALVILYDQVPRNCFRGRADAFSSDVAARDLARRAVDRGFDLALGEDERSFLYLPFEHAEDLPAQRLGVALYAARVSDPEALLYAERHAEIIIRFGRFPHRNPALGRQSTPEEIAFLQEPMSSF